MSSRAHIRGDATRSALIRAALEIFGRDGYEAASTRAIATAAGANQALIGFHFGSKKGLYLATFEHVAAGIAERIGPLLAVIRNQLDANGGKRMSARARLEALLPLVHRVTDALVVMYTSEESKPWARLILREQQDPSEAFEILFDQGFGALIAALTELVARAQNRSPREREVRLTVLTIIGQALMFRVASAAVLRHLGRRRIASQDVADIQSVIRRNVTAILQAGAA